MPVEQLRWYFGAIIVFQKCTLELAEAGYRQEGVLFQIPPVQLMLLPSNASDKGGFINERA